MPRWRSSAVALVVLGVAAPLAGCSQEETQTQQRNGYATREDCLKDYPPEQCQSTRSSSGGLMFLGPWYLVNRLRAPANDPGPGATAVNGRSQAAIPSAGQTTSVRRSGFGATGRNSGFSGG